MCVSVRKRVCLCAGVSTCMGGCGGLYVRVYVREHVCLRVSVHQYM